MSFPIQMMAEEEDATDGALFFALSEAFDEMYGYLKEIYEIYIGLDCEKYSKKELRKFVENTHEDARELHNKWFDRSLSRINKAIADSSVDDEPPRYTECVKPYFSESSSSKDLSEGK